MTADIIKMGAVLSFGGEPKPTSKIGCLYFGPDDGFAGSFVVYTGAEVMPSRCFWLVPGTWEAA